MDEKSLENAAAAMNEAAIQSEQLVAQPTPSATVQPEPAQQPQSTPTGTKKSKKGLIIGVSVGAVAVLGLGGVGIAYAITNSPENIALSAVSDFLSSKTMGINGVFELSMTNSTDSKSASIALKTDENADKETSTTATLNVNYKDKEYSVDLGSVVLKDYTIYIKLENLKEAAKQLLKDFTTDATYGSYAELYEDLVNSVVGEVGGVWWKISVPEVVDKIDVIDSSDKTLIKEAYNCVIDAAGKATKNNDKYVQIYKDNAFVKLEKYEGGKKFSSKGTAYNVSLDAKKLTSFANKMTDEIDSLGIGDCMDKLNGISGVSTTYTKEEVKQNDIEKALEKLPNIVVTVDGFFSHTITGVYVNYEQETYSGKVELNFNKNINAISAPSDAKSITDLYDNVVKSYEDWQATAICKVYKTQYPTYYNQVCDVATGKVKPEYKNIFEI